MFSPHSHLSVKSKVPTIPGSHSRGLYRLDLASLSCSASRSSDRFSPRRQYQPAGCLRPSTLLPGENESDANILKKNRLSGFSKPISSETKTSEKYENNPALFKRESCICSVPFDAANSGKRPDREWRTWSASGTRAVCADKAR